MNDSVTKLLLLGAAMFAIISFLSVWQNIYSLNGIKNKKVGHGQHGNARFATEKEIKRIYRLVPYEPKKWRRNKGDGDLLQGTVVETRKYGRKLYSADLLRTQKRRKL